MPTDPSGSLYLSRMADLTTVGLGRRRLLRRSHEFAQGTESTMINAERRVDTPEKANEYERALRQSQMARRRSSAMAQSRLGVPSSSSIFQSGLGLGMAQTAVLGDSNGSILPPTHMGEANLQTSTIPEEDLVDDGGVGSALGESYVDGRRPKGPSVSQSQQEEDEQLEDGGVLGLLAEIYGTGANLKGRGRGPPRAI